MGTKHSALVDEYLCSEGYPDALARNLRRAFERAVQSQSAEALEKLKSGDVTNHGRNEAFILSAVPAELQAEARLFLYGPYLSLSKFLWSILSDKSSTASQALEAFASAPAARRSGGSDEEDTKRRRRKSSSAGMEITPPPPGIRRPTTAIVAQAAKSPLMTSIACKVERKEAGAGVAVVSQHTESGFMFVRRGELLLSDDKGGVQGTIAAGSVIEIGLPLDGYLYIHGSGSNESQTLPRATTCLKSPPHGGVLYGFLGKEVLLSIINGFRMTRLRDVWDRVEAEALEEQERVAAAAAAAKVTMVTTQLCEAAKRGSVREMQELITAGALVNQVIGNQGETALHFAVRGQQLRSVELLLGGDANPFTASSVSGETSLHIACRQGWTEGVAVLMRHSPSLISFAATRGARSTPLHVAARQNHASTLRVIVAIAKELDVALPTHVTNATGVTAIDVASTIEVLRILKPRTDLGMAETVR